MSISNNNNNNNNNNSDISCNSTSCTINKLIKDEIKNGFGNNSIIFDLIGIPNHIFDPYGLTYGEQISNKDYNEMMINIIKSIPNLFPLISGFFTTFFENPIDLKIDKENLNNILIKMLNNNNNNSDNNNSLLLNNKDWFNNCLNLMFNIYNYSNDLKKLLIEKKDKLLNHNYDYKKDKESHNQTKNIIENNIEKLEKSIQDLLIFLSNSIENIDEIFGIYFESIFIYIAFIHNVDLLWEVYELNPILISGAKQNDRLTFENISSYREKLHLFISSYLKDVGKTSNKTITNSYWNDMYKVLSQDLIYYPQKLIIFNELNIDSYSNFKLFKLPELSNNINQNYIFRFDSKNLLNNNNNLKEYITGSYGLSIFGDNNNNNNNNNSKLSFLIESKKSKFISIRLFNMVSNNYNNENNNISIKLLNFENNEIIDKDLKIKPIENQLAVYLPSKNNLDSNLVGFTHSNKMKLDHIGKSLIEIDYKLTTNNKDKKLYLYFIEILVSYNNDN